MKIHFIGIGGIGVSALARYFLAQGNEVNGSDCSAGPILEELEQAGARIFIGHKKENLDSRFCGNDRLVIYSAAVPADNPELVEARERDIKCQSYAEALGELTKKMFTIAVSGMHGKSTTTAMIGLMMEKAGLDPTVIVGTKVREWNNNKNLKRKKGERKFENTGSNFRFGRGKYLVIEADEYNRSFLNYWPKILVLLNIEEEHLDTYAGGLPDIVKTFKEYIGHLPADGVLIVNDEDKNITKILKSQFSIFNEFSNPRFQIKKYGLESIENLKLKVSGEHNLSNANAAMAVAKVLGIDEKVAVAALNEFIGTWRRMEYRGEINGAKIYDDYGHHPTEIKATLAGARELLPERSAVGAKSKAIASDPSTCASPKASARRADSGNKSSRLWCVFQPHQYQRTHLLFNQFVNAFGAADEVILLPIYSVVGRESEEIKKKVSSKKLAKAINDKMQDTRHKIQKNNSKKIIYHDSFEKTTEYLRQNLQPGDVCVIMGAGDIYRLSERLIQISRSRTS